MPNSGRGFGFSYSTVYEIDPSAVRKKFSMQDVTPVLFRHGLSKAWAEWIPSRDAFGLRHCLAKNLGHCRENPGASFSPDS